MNQGAVFFNKTCSIESNMQHSKMTLSRNNEYDFFSFFSTVIMEFLKVLETKTA